MSSSAMAVDPAPPPKFVLDEFIGAAIANTPPALHPYFESFRTLYSKKLWHQLTIKLFEFFDLPESRPFAVDTFTHFVRDFESKLNQLRLVEMCVKVAYHLDNPQEQIVILTSLLSRLNKEKPNEPHVLLLSSLAYSKLGFGDALGAKGDMDEAWKILDQLDSVETTVNASYYRVAADYYKSKAEYAQYYKNSLLYLACVDVEKDMSQEERYLRAHDLALAAFLADTIYNFGELLMHPILDALDSTQHEWLKKLLFTFNEGNIGKFEALAPLFPQEPILQENYSFLRQKICLMALIDAVFRRTGGDQGGRTMSFQTISEETRLPYEEVEHLMMKAMSLKLVKGSLDQVDELAQITWVQPRVLDKEQIGVLAKRLDVWVNKLNTVEKRIESETQGSNAIVA